MYNSNWLKLRVDGNEAELLPCEGLMCFRSDFLHVFTC